MAIKIIGDSSPYMPEIAWLIETLNGPTLYYSVEGFCPIASHGTRFKSPWDAMAVCDKLTTPHRIVEHQWGGNVTVECVGHIAEMKYGGCEPGDSTVTIQVEGSRSRAGFTFFARKEEVAHYYPGMQVIVQIRPAPVQSDEDAGR